MEETPSKFKVVDKRRFDESGNERELTDFEEEQRSTHEGAAENRTQQSGGKSSAICESAAVSDSESGNKMGTGEKRGAITSNISVDTEQPDSLIKDKELDQKISEGYDRSNEGSEKNISFASFVLSLTYQTLIHLGEVSGVPSAAIDLESARNTIDILDILRDKTKGNLTPEEQELLDNTVRSLKFKYIEVTNRFQQRR